MKEYTIVRRPADADWSLVPALAIDTWQCTEPLPISAQAQICYNEQALYVRLQAVEQNIRAELTGIYDMVCEDSCLEFFFCPKEGDPRYFNIEVNPNGAMFLGFGSSIPTLARLICEEPAIIPQSERTPEGWQTTYAIPYEFIRRFFPDFSPKPGSSMRANCYKCGDLTVQKHYLSWNPVPEDGFTFHRPAHFGIMHFA